MVTVWFTVNPQSWCETDRFAYLPVNLTAVGVSVREEPQQRGRVQDRFSMRKSSDLFMPMQIFYAYVLIVSPCFQPSRRPAASLQPTLTLNKTFRFFVTHRKIDLCLCVVGFFFFKSVCLRITQ